MRYRMEILYNCIINIHKRMDWKSIKFDWNRARAFLVTAEEGSLSAAARALGMTQPTLGRQVSALEQELDVVLFERVGRGLSLTPSGLELMEHVRSMGEAANKISLTANGQSKNIEGNICISASEVYAYYLLPPIIAKLRNKYPGINIELVATNTASDLSRREADIALRNFRPTQLDLITKKVKIAPAQLYATPAYLKKIGMPSKLEDLDRADFIGLSNPQRLMQGLNEMGLNLSLKNFPLQTESHLVHWALVKQGIGIGIMPVDIGDNEPLVKRVLVSFKSIMYPIWLTTHRELKTSRRVRLVFDMLAAELA